MRHTITAWDAKLGLITLNDGTVERLVPETVRFHEATGQLSCRVHFAQEREGQPALFGRAAQTDFLWSVHWVDTRLYTQYGEVLVPLPGLGISLAGDPRSPAWGGPPPAEGSVPQQLLA